MYKLFVSALLIVLIAIAIYYYYKKDRSPTLYDKLGGIYSIAYVVNDFSDRIIADPLVGKESPNTYLRDWSNNKTNRLPGLKFMRTLWLASLAGGPFNYHGTVPGKCSTTRMIAPISCGCPFSLENAHRKFHINSAEFDRVAELLNESLVSAGVEQTEREGVMAAFMAHKSEVVEGKSPLYC